MEFVITIFAKWTHLLSSVKHSAASPTKQRHHIHHFVRLQRWWRRSFRMDLSDMEGWTDMSLVQDSSPRDIETCNCWFFMCPFFRFSNFVLAILLPRNWISPWLCRKWQQMGYWILYRLGGFAGHSQMNHWFGLLLRCGFLVGWWPAMLHFPYLRMTKDRDLFPLWPTKV